MREIVAVALRCGQLGAGGRQLSLDASDLFPGRCNGSDIEASEDVQKRPMPAWVEKAAIVMLSVDFDRKRADVAEQSCRHGGSPDEGPTSAIRLERPADDQRL